VIHLLALFLAFATPGGVDVVVDHAPDADLKAAFVVNFTKFADWSSLAPDSPIVMCVVGDEPVAAALAAITRGQQIGGHPIQLLRLPAPPPPAPCHVLWVPATAVPAAGEMLRTVRDRLVLTVSDAARFALSTGIIELYVDNGRMRFAINVTAAQRSHLKLSSRLLGLARIVRDDDGQ
jgi:YfiR/HmsC-like